MEGIMFSIDPELAVELFVKFERDMYWEEIQLAELELEYEGQWDNAEESESYH